ncbi:MAG: AMP-binding protein [Rhodobiaceae bacterium]|nr:AMP-binding protein [Rhodobiaceae bacterium]MCC0056017.1 AMP-binding protein [Rhodobiaceae bacterium]
MTDHPTLPELIARHAAETPDRIALIAAEGGEITWAGLKDRAKVWGAWLAARGVKSGDHVATLVPNSIEANLCWLGCIAAGAIEVSVNANFRGDWLRNALAVSGARTVVCADRYLAGLLEVLDGTAIERILVFDGTSDTVGSPSVTIARESPEALDLEPLAETFRPAQHDIACVLYTSGTTGASKAVQIPWRQLSRLMDVDHYGDGQQVFYCPYAPYHLSGRNALYRGALFNGTTVIREAFSTSEFWDDVKRYGVTWTILYPATTRFLTGLPASSEDSRSTLKWVLMCPLIPEIDEVKQRYGLNIYSVYGMTEICTPFGVAPEYADAAHVGCCGRPLPGTEARIVDANDYEVAEGEAGELVVRSDSAWAFTPGYLGAPEATAKAWRNGWFHTGDVMRKDADGLYYYVDRAKDMIRRRGENISSVELEAELLRCPGVAEAAAFGVPSELGDEEVMAVVRSGGGKIDPASLVAVLQARVPRYAVPRFVRIVSEFPRTPATQRIEKHRLKAEGVTADTWENPAMVRR